MAGLYHYFYVQTSLIDCAPDGLHPKGVYPTKIHDNVISYIWDSISWIPAETGVPVTGGFGLERWGPSVVRADGARVAKKVFHGWAMIFSCGPEQLQLSHQNLAGRWRSRNNKLRFSRDKLVGDFSAIAAYCDEVLAGKGVLIHHGI